MDTVKHLCIASTITRVLLISIWFISDMLILDHFPGVDVLKLKNFQENFFQSFTKWDSAHILMISLSGYRQESLFAFFPLYPYLVMILAEISLFVFDSWISVETTHAIIALILSNICFTISTAILFYLVRKMCTSNFEVAVAVAMFICNPANVFFVGIYTESIFSTFSWSGMYLMEKRMPLKAGIMFIFASLLRSNGLLNLVFVVAFQFSNRYIQKNKQMGFLSFIYLCLCTSIPYLVWNKYIQQMLCSNPVFFESHRHELCEQLFPNMYAMIQEKYWNVGFLKYFQIRQIPNFLLATPIIIIALSAIISFIYKLIPMLKEGRVNSSLSRMLPYICHLVVVLGIGIFFAHVQIITRLICSSCPIIYIEMGRLLVKSQSFKFYMFLYLFLYNFAGFVLHPNFYPWT